MARTALQKQRRVLNELLVVTHSGTRGRGRMLARLDAGELRAKVHEFLEQVQTLIAAAPTLTSGYQLQSLEVSAEITAKGSLALLGTGGEAGGAAGLKFVFQLVPRATG
jgi:hypothetical protein